MVWLAAIALVACAACDTPGVTLIDPDVSDDDDRSLTVTVQLEDTALAQVLAWENGVPEAQVLLNRVGDEFDPIVLQTDSTGTAKLQMLLPGQYRIAAQRVLREDEAGAAGVVVRAFGDGRIASLSAPAVLELALRADQAGSIVVSEVLPGVTPMIGRYDWYQYFELYNNSDTTVYLDAMLWGKAWELIKDYDAFPCQVTERWRNDSLGVWAMYIHRFPGTGADYPVGPGEIVTVALDAIDHSTVNPLFPDLTSADFELEGSADPDNPDVPNMPQVGPSHYHRGHGLQLYRGVWFLSLPLEVESLVTLIDPFGGREWVRIPSPALVDVVMWDFMLPIDDNFVAPCTLPVPRMLDRLAAAVPNIAFEHGISMHRKGLRMNHGRILLHDVNVSFVDFVQAALTPGSIEADSIPWPR